MKGERAAILDPLLSFNRKCTTVIARIVLMTYFDVFNIADNRCHVSRRFGGSRHESCRSLAKKVSRIVTRFFERSLEINCRHAKVEGKAILGGFFVELPTRALRFCTKLRYDHSVSCNLCEIIYCSHAPRSSYLRLQCDGITAALRDTYTRTLCCKPVMNSSSPTKKKLMTRYFRRIWITSRKRKWGNYSSVSFLRKNFTTPPPFIVPRTRRSLGYATFYTNNANAKKREKRRYEIPGWDLVISRKLGAMSSLSLKPLVSFFSSVRAGTRFKLLRVIIPSAIFQSIAKIISRIILSHLIAL